MKVFILLSRFPYPLEKGDKLRAYHQIKELSKSHDLFVVCLSDKQVSENQKLELSKFCVELEVLRLSKWKIYANVFKQLFTDKPFQVGYFYQKNWAKFIEQKIRQIQPDHIYTQLIRTSEYVKNIHDIPKTLDYMDALGQGMIRRYKNTKGVGKYFFKAEGKRLINYEHRIFDYFDHHTIISAQDRLLISHPNNLHITVVENGISPEFFEIKTIEKSFDLVFVGNMNYAPNIACAKFIVEEILPEIQKTHSDIRLLLSGANPHKEIQELGNNKNVTVSGWVEDIRDSYACAHIFIAPLFIGTGLQNKLLEAMAQQIPCITTTLANNALGAKENESILIANSKEEFVKKIQLLLENDELKSQIKANAKAYVENHFSWPKSTLKLAQLFKK